MPNSKSMEGVATAIPAVADDPMDERKAIAERLDSPFTPSWSAAMKIGNPPMRLRKYLFFLFCLVVLGLPVAKFLGVIDWSWWIVAAPIWLTCIVALGGGVVMGTMLFPPPPR